jgi:hypothetical protein
MIERLIFLPIPLDVLSATRCTWPSVPGRVQAFPLATVPSIVDKWHEYGTPCGHHRPGTVLVVAAALVSVRGLAGGQVAASVRHVVVGQPGAFDIDVSGRSWFVGS